MGPFSGKSTDRSGSVYLEHLCDMMEKVQMFTDFKREELQVLAGYMQYHEAKKGTEVFSEGGREGYMCFVIDGKLDILKESEYGKPTKITVVRGGKTIGEMSIIDGLPHSASAIVAEDSNLIMFSKFNFEKLCDEKPDLALRLLVRISRLMSLRLRQTSGVLVSYLKESGHG
jgi:CRP/FNR family cyclic AMP-dependent transcriptional regulator